MDEDFGFNMDDFDEEEFNCEQKQKRELPVYIKAMELVDIIKSIVGLIDPEKDQLHLVERMMEKAYTIPAKIAGAEGGDLFSIRFDNATIIKLTARELLYETSLLKASQLCDEQYVELLRNEIDEFRILFLDWVKSFDKTNDIEEDDWDIKKFI
jgi:hypothetical protein